MAQGASDSGLSLKPNINKLMAQGASDSGLSLKPNMKPTRRIVVGAMCAKGINQVW